MKNVLFYSIFLSSLFCLSNCTTTESKPPGLKSTSSPIPWNRPLPGEGSGILGALPGNR